MKKLKIERTNTNINRLTQKRSSLNQQPLFVPYKIDWRPVSPSNIENQSNSKVFFQNMKAELSTIKNDFQKLIKREINLKLENDQPLKPTNTNKTKSYSTSRKQSKAENVPKEGLRYGKDQEEQLNRILNLQKNLPCSSKMQLKQTFAKSLQVREQRVMTSAFQAVQIGVHQKSRCNDQSNEQHKLLNEKAEELQKELQKSLFKIQKLQQEKGELNICIANKDTIIQNQAKQLQNKTCLLEQLQEEINNMKSSIGLVHNQKDNLISENQNIINEMNNMHQHLSELSFHHNQLNLAYNGLLAQHNQQNESFINMQRFCQDLQRRCSDIEADGRRKIDYLKKDIQEYQKREDMFSREIENLKLQLKQKPTVVYPAEFTYNLANAEMENLRDEIFHLTRQLQIQKQLHQNLSNKCIEQLSNTNNMEQITRNFEEKVANLLDENTKLKCRVNLAESKLESMSLQNKSYLEEIKLYEEREKLQMNKKQITTNQWEELTDEIQRLKTENAKLQLQLEISQNGETQYRENNNQGGCEKLLSLSYQQRTQIEQLKQSVIALTKENDQLRKEMAHERKKLAMFQSENVEVELKSELSCCKQVNRRLKEVLFQFVSSKLVMRQDDEQSDYYINKLDQLRRQIM